MADRRAESGPDSPWDTGAAATPDHPGAAFDTLTVPPAGDDGFDPYNMNTWRFRPAPTPWYRTRPAVVAMVAAGLAASALVVSGVLLVLGGSGPAPPEPESATPATPTSSAPKPTPTTRPPEPPPPPPPPEETAAVQQAPAYRPTQRPPRRTKAPEFGVTRTPQTRAPISVAPQPRG